MTNEIEFILASIINHTTWMMMDKYNQVSVFILKVENVATKFKKYMQSNVATLYLGSFISLDNNHTIISHVINNGK